MTSFIKCSPCIILILFIGTVASFVILVIKQLKKLDEDLVKGGKKVKCFSCSNHSCPFNPVFYCLLDYGENRAKNSDVTEDNSDIKKDNRCSNCTNYDCPINPGYNCPFYSKGRKVKFIDKTDEESGTNKDNK